jgi:hypothetical protein
MAADWPMIAVVLRQNRCMKPLLARTLATWRSVLEKPGSAAYEVSPRSDSRLFSSKANCRSARFDIP